MKITGTLFLLFFTSVLYGQKLIKTEDFSVGTPFLEPDGRVEVVKLSDNEFVTLSKAKGNQSGPSDYVLEKYDANLKKLFSVNLVAGPDEDYNRLHYNGSEIQLFSVNHDYFNQRSELKVYLFDPSNGKKKEEKTLVEHKVGKFADVRFKGAVKETFTDCVLSSLKPGFVTPMEYQYEIKFSPDRQRFIAYIFDYSKPDLEAVVKMYDKNLKPLQEGTVPVDKNFINYGIFPNNEGSLFVLNVDRLGRIMLVKYNMSTNDINLLDLQYSSTQRESLTLKILNNDEVYLANTNTRDGALVGVMFTKFNFGKRIVEQIHYHELGTGLKQTISASRQSNPALANQEDWLNFYITDFFVDDEENVLMILEKRQLVSTNYTCDGTTVMEVNRWKERMGDVHAEGLLLFKFDKDGKLLWEDFYLKSQKNNLGEGLISASYTSDRQDGVLRMVYASSTSLGGTYNQTNYVEWDLSTGEKIKDIPLHGQGEDLWELGLLKNYSLWWPGKVVLAGKKGFFGKKTYLTLFDLDVKDN